MHMIKAKTNKSLCIMNGSCYFERSRVSTHVECSSKYKFNQFLHKIFVQLKLYIITNSALNMNLLIRRICEVCKVRLERSVIPDHCSAVISKSGNAEQ